MRAFQDLLADDSSSGRHLLVLTDTTGEILWRVGSREALRRADRLEFTEGTDWSAAGIGTNAISEALVTGGPVQLFSAEHLVRTHHDWGCTAAPITDPLTGGLLGVLDVSGPLDTISADTLRMVRCAVRVAESLLGTSDGGASVSASPSVCASRQAVRPGAAVSSLELLGPACRGVCGWELGAADAAPGGDPGAAGLAVAGVECRRTGVRTPWRCGDAAGHPDGDAPGSVDAG